MDIEQTFYHQLSQVPKLPDCGTSFNAQKAKEHFNALHGFSAFSDLNTNLLKKSILKLSVSQERADWVKIKINEISGLLGGIYPGSK